MGFSQDELPTGGDWSPPTCSVRREGGNYCVEMSVEEDCFGPLDRSPPASSVRSECGNCWVEIFPEEACVCPLDWSRSACSVRRIWGYCWVGTLGWEMDCIWPVYDFLGSENWTRSIKISVSSRPSSRCLPLRRDITGSKRRIRETSLCPGIERPFCPRHSEGPSKKLRKLGHQIHHGACYSDSKIRKSRSSSMGKDCDNPKSREGNSLSLCILPMSSMSHLAWVRRIVLRELTGKWTVELFVMRMPSDLGSLVRHRGWNSLAPAYMHAASGLGLNCWFRVREQSVSGEASLVEVIKMKATSTGWDSVLNDLREHIVGLFKVLRFWNRQQSVTLGTEKNSNTTTWDSLPNDLQENVLKKLDFRDLCRCKTTSSSWKKLIESDAFRESRGGISEGEFTAINYYIKNKSWRCSGYDLHSKSWRSFPTVSYLPPPDAELFKEYSVCGHGGLMCAEVSKLPKRGELVVFNPWTRKTRALPPVLYPRNPVLVHILVDPAKKSYKVILAGSSAASDEHLSRKVEVFESSTSKWKEVCDLPGPAFGLNEHQAGVCLNGKLFFISFLESGGRGVVALDVENGTWLPDLTVPIPWSSYSNTLQLVESDGKLFLFSEQELDQSVDHCVDELEFPNPKAGLLTCRWRNVVKAKKSGGRGLQVYPEHTCVGFGEGKLCIFNTLSRDGVVYDMRDGKKCEDLVPPPANQMGENFFSLNPATFTLQPNFAIEC